MNRRSFLGLFGAGVAGIAIEQAIPFGRVWSFPKEIVVAQHPFDFSANQLRAFQMLNETIDNWQRDFSKRYAIGATINVHYPQAWIEKEGTHVIHLDQIAGCDFEF